MNDSSHIKQVLRMPATLTDVKKKQDRIGSCTEHVAKFQKVNASVVLSPATSALVREIHAGNLAIIFDQHLGEATTLNLKFLCDWYYRLLAVFFFLVTQSVCEETKLRRRAESLSRIDTEVEARRRQSA